MNAIVYFANMKNFKAVCYIIAIFAVGLSALIYFSLGQSEKTVPKIRLSYFKNTSEVSQSIGKILQQQLITQKYFWIGVEPGHDHHLQLITSILETWPAFDLIILDQELSLSKESIEKLKVTHLYYVRENWFELAKLIQQNADKKILVITAAIYSTNLLKENPVHKVLKQTSLKPVTFSMGYFAVNTDDEKKNIFRCVTDDKEGVAAWGCLVLNKARSQRRKIDSSKIAEPSNLMAGMMDLTGEKDYMLLLR